MEATWRFSDSVEATVTILGHACKILPETEHSGGSDTSARYEYGAFGVHLRVSGTAIAADNPFRFSTKYLDHETGLYEEEGYGYHARLRNCVGFVCDALSYIGFEIRPPPIDFGEDPFRFPKDLEQAIRYWRNQAVEQARREDVGP